MFVCHRCNTDARVQCTQCLNKYDYPCSGITEAGYRRLGEKKQATWKCSQCRVSGGRSTSPACIQIDTPVVGQVLAHDDLSDIRLELTKLREQTASLPQLIENVKIIQSSLSELVSIKNEMADVKNSLNYVHTTVDQLSTKLLEVDQEIQSLQKSKDDIARLEHRLGRIEASLQESEQRSRMNNIEIKGVPVTNSENLFNIVAKISDKVGCRIAKEQINYIARVPQRNNKDNKNIIVALHNRYLRDDFITAAKKLRSLTASDIGLTGNSKIYVNDHLTLENKQLLNKAKVLAKQKDFSFIWVKNCKILAKKNPTSSTHAIKTDMDLKKIC
ncbi:uncharacterized protein LOC121739495 [Aricia agestis]|uniref:uncharacterized protein LOC121739495 n=1 Tax=Aricia agestis TaxID=91739 RepID=UPI001C20B52D|nr:uncharacterized protein LOC121739495 [Aricia agestis]